MALVVAAALIAPGCGSSKAQPLANATSVATVAVDQTTTVPAATPTRVPAPTPTSTATPTPTSTATPTPTETPAPSPTMATIAPSAQGAPDASIDAMYRANLPVGELYKQIAKYKGWRVKYTGTVLSIQTDNTNLTILQLTVDPPMGDPLGDDDVIDVATAVDCTGIIQNSRITIWGEPDSMTTITNVYGGHVDQPMLGGVYIQKLGS